MYEKYFLLFFNVFKIFVRIFVHKKSTSSVVTYLIFEFLIPACFTYTFGLVHFRTHTVIIANTKITLATVM